MNSQTLWGFPVLIGASLIAGLLHPLPASPELVSLNPSQVRALAPILFVDARPPRAFSHQHIPGALNLPAESLVLGHSWRLTQRHGRIVVYCDFTHCNAARRVAEELRRQGHSRVFLLSGGLSAWDQP